MKSPAPIHTFPVAGILFTLSLLLLALSAAAGEAADNTTPRQAEIARAIAPSIVQVAYTLRFDESDPPVSRGWNERCPNCGSYHSDRVESLLQEERPAERPGFILSPDRILTGHLLVHPRFIEKIEVRHGDRTVTARPASYAVEQRALILELSEPLEEARPLEFKPTDNGDLYLVTAQESRGRWVTSVRPIPGSVFVRADGSGGIAAAANSVIVDASGRPVGATMAEELPADDTWKGSPEAWELVSAADMDRKLERLASRTRAQLPRVSLRFRSPREEPSDRYAMARAYSGLGRDDENATEREAVAILLDEGIMLILAELSPSTTGRLERIRVHLPNRDAPADAQFVASLHAYGALLARLDEPVSGIGLSEDSADLAPGRLLLASEIHVSGDQRRAHHETARIADLRKGYRGNLLPDLAGSSENMFLFTPDGELAAFPLEIRRRSVGDGQRRRSAERIVAPAGMLKALLDDLDAHIDPANTPVDPDEEGRLAWVGLEIQPLDSGLARDLNVAAQTENGRTGALVSHVYPGSPAAEAGVEPGDVLLSVTADGLPHPQAVRLDDDSRYSEPFPWDQLDEIPDQYYSYLPLPWTSAANPFNRFLTELGFGSEVTVNAVRDSESIRHTLVLQRGPAHYEAASQHRSDSLGLTVRELTFETRRYFQKTEDDPGLIVARIEPGTDASSSGLKPYELITHINGDPVFTAEQFEDGASVEPELRLSVQRMHQGRIVLLQNASAPDS